MVFNHYNQAFNSKNRNPFLALRDRFYLNKMKKEAELSFQKTKIRFSKTLADSGEKQF